MSNEELPFKLLLIARRLPPWLHDRYLLEQIEGKRIKIPLALSFILGSESTVRRLLGDQKEVVLALRTLRSQRDWNEIAAVLMYAKYLGRSLLSAIHGPFPEPPFAATTNLRPLSSRRQLRRESHEMRNCCSNAKYASEVRVGLAYFYHWSDGDEQVTVCLQRTIPGQWAVPEMRSFNNQEPSVATQRQIVTALAAALGDDFCPHPLPDDPCSTDDQPLSEPARAVLISSG